jgi:hypothetical protein
MSYSDFWYGFEKAAGLVDASKAVIKKVNFIEKNPKFIGKVAPVEKPISEYEKMWKAHDLAKTKPKPPAPTLDYSKGGNVGSSTPIAPKTTVDQKRMAHAVKGGYTDQQMRRAGMPS